jgi:nucleotide-binding universal stress UspA family protein
MFERIVVGFDESEGSRDALALGSALAERLGAELVVAGVVPAPIGGSFLPAMPAEAYSHLAEQARKGVELAASENGGRAQMVEATSAARGLEELTEQMDGDLLVIGCDRTPEGTVRAGHKARVLLQGSPCAVALAPVGYRDSAKSTSFDLVGAAVDGSPESRRALDAAAEIASGGTVRLISVATDFAEVWGFWGTTYALSELDEASRDSTRKLLDEAEAALPEGSTSEKVMVEGIAADQIRAESARGLDLLCLGSRGYGPLRRVLLGSVSSDLLHEVSCPVMVIPRGSSEPSGD